ncbi:MAG: hypothetical protein IJL16_04985 [Clostridia bacterium]|nr:hypothetical protein [Clostridia bacterium]
MFEKIKIRYITIFIIIMLISAVMVLKIFGLKAPEQENAMNKNVVSVSVPGKRGSIYDRNGVLLAYDEEAYDVIFYRDPVDNASSDRARYTQIFMDCIEIIEKNGDKLSNSFLITKNEDGKFVYNISAELTEEQRTSRIDRWCSNMQISDPEMEPEDIYYDLRNRFRIPENVSYEEAVKILSIWQEVQNNMYQSYKKVTIATNVSLETVYELETRGEELKGVEIAQSYVRIYPKKEVASNIIGYLGRIVDNQELEEKKEKGYTAETLLGKIGIEATMEEYLTGSITGRLGTKTYILDDKGSIKRVANYVAPGQGDSVVLTIDIGLQEVAEKALAENVKKIRREQEQTYARNRSKYDKLLNERAVKTLSLANSGAAIVMEVKTCNVLALARYPSFDNNLFTGGISEEDYKALLEQEGAPLFDNSISSTSTPGSIFKMATALAGLMEGKIKVNSVIDDSGPYDKYVSEGADAPACWVKPRYSKHGKQTVISALKNSCNYFFFEVADRLGIDKLTEWVGRLGMTSKTGIQLTGEAVGWIGGPKIIYDSSLPINAQKTSRPLLVYNKLKTQLEGYGEDRGVTYTEEQLEEATLGLIKLVDLQRLDIGPEIREVLSRVLDIPTNVVLRRGWTSEIMSTLIELIWTPTDTVTQGIGATPTQLTPIAVARYLCAISNGGRVYTANILKRIVDSRGKTIVDSKAELLEDLHIPEEYSEAIMEGMEQVVSWENRGTAGSAFLDFKYRKILAGKTGTAPISNIDLEDNIWLCLVAPKEDPEIAVVLFVPNGLSDSKVYDTAKAIITYYFDQKEAEKNS